jgi:hypothetical protein
MENVHSELNDILEATHIDHIIESKNETLFYKDEIIAAVVTEIYNPMRDKGGSIYFGAVCFMYF